MPIKEKLVLTVKNRKDPGNDITAIANELIDVLTETWEEFRKKFGELPEDQQDQMFDHFEDKLEYLGDILLGEDSSAEDMYRFVNSR